jgi:hypothetical protein
MIGVLETLLPDLPATLILGQPDYPVLARTSLRKIVERPFVPRLLLVGVAD